jgi:hypothetical protein
MVISTLVFTAGEAIGTGSHGAAALCKSGPASAANVRSTAAAADMRRAVACSAAAFGGGAQRRAGHDDRRSGQSNRYFAHHDAQLHSF